jgi:hypothetical protein
MLKMKVFGTSRILMGRVKEMGLRVLLLVLVYGGAEIIQGTRSASALSLDDGSVWVLEI